MKPLQHRSDARNDTIEGVLTAYEHSLTRRLCYLIILMSVAAGAFCLDVASGPSSVTLGDFVSAIWSPDDLPRSTTVILWQLRLPQAVMALLVGFALGLAGAEMQTVLNNALADPFTLGVSSAAALGASVAIVFGLSLPGLSAQWFVPVNAFAFSILSLFALQLLARVRGGGVESLVLFGIALGFTFGAILTLIQFLASADTLQQLVFWSMGSLVRTDWSTVTLLAVALCMSAPFTFASAPKLTVLQLGEERARSSGIGVRRLRALSLVRICLMAATAVSFVGIIGFVGLTAPHAARLMIGEDHRFFLPASALIGMIVMSFAAVAGKTLAPGVIIPIGIVTALIGLPVFFFLLLRRRERS